MASTYVVQAPAHAGGTIAWVTPALTGDYSPTGTGVGLLVNQGTAPGTVTLPLSSTMDGLAVASRTVACAANSFTLIPLPSVVYGIANTAVNYSSIATATVACIQVAT